MVKGRLKKEHMCLLCTYYSFNREEKKKEGMILEEKISSMGMGMP